MANIFELRIGNFMWDGSGEILIIQNIYGREATIDVSKTSSSDVVLCDLKHIAPIPLTKEWLLKFGWVWNSECKSWEKFPNGDARMNLAFRDVSVSYTMFNYVLKATIADRIYYVHQLQNLIFALTGEELTINQK